MSKFKTILFISFVLFLSFTFQTKLKKLHSHDIEGKGEGKIKVKTTVNIDMIKKNFKNELKKHIDNFKKEMHSIHIQVEEALSESLDDLTEKFQLLQDRIDGAHERFVAQCNISVEKFSEINEDLTNFFINKVGELVHKKIHNVEDMVKEIIGVNAEA